ncbi:uncharacterized protein LOC113002954 [Solenopsis invicta]|uniref:uncharacterized protein LOC113002954 n=1 Tax=Solenopsis invicta TaxID=13686 RepID=UPI000E33F40E|nr:uncharacterized protein LOC113002954 [Solenopsis invicta]
MFGAAVETRCSWMKLDEATSGKRICSNLNREKRLNGGKTRSKKWRKCGWYEGKSGWRRGSLANGSEGEGRIRAYRKDIGFALPQLHFASVGFPSNHRSFVAD